MMYKLLLALALITTTAQADRIFVEPGNACATCSANYDLYLTSKPLEQIPHNLVDPASASTMGEMINVLIQGGHKVFERIRERQDGMVWHCGAIEPHGDLSTELLWLPDQALYAVLRDGRRLKAELIVSTGHDMTAAELGDVVELGDGLRAEYSAMIADYGTRRLCPVFAGFEAGGWDWSEIDRLCITRGGWDIE